ncbi:MAG: hypothetical protein ABEJ82_02820 [Haloplanus sp.]
MKRREVLEGIGVSLSFPFLATSSPSDEEWAYDLVGTTREEIGGDWSALYLHTEETKHLAVSFDSDEDVYRLFGSDIVTTVESEQEMIAAVKDVVTEVR